MSEPRRCLLGVDLGDRRTGLAVTAAVGPLVMPLDPVVARDDQSRVAAIRAVCEAREVELVVVGLPLSEDGSEGPRARRTRAFVGRLRKGLEVPVELVDERYTSEVAHERLAELGVKAARRRELVDSVAAMVILERYLQQLGEAGQTR